MIKSIKIPNNFVQQYKYNNLTVFIYGLLQKTLTERKQVIFNLRWIFDSLNVGSNETRKRERIKNSLVQLQNGGYINFNCDIKSINKNKLIFANWTEIEKSYVPILDHEFDAIHGYTDAYVEKIFCLFASIKSRIDSKKYCYPGYKTLRKDTGINSDPSISKYEKILRDELHLIDYECPGEIVITNKQGKKETTTGNNIYVVTSQEGYKEILQKALEKKKSELKKFYKDIDMKITNHDKGNKKRSETQKKNWAKKKGVEEDNSDSTDPADWGTTHQINPFDNVDDSQLVKGKSKSTNDFIITDEMQEQATEQVKEKAKIEESKLVEWLDDMDNKLLENKNNELPEIFLWEDKEYESQRLISDIRVKVKNNQEIDLMDYVFIKENENNIDRDTVNMFMDKFVDLKLEKQEELTEGHNDWIVKNLV